MNPPWTGKTGLAKATAVLATILCISIGLCGVNFVGVMSLNLFTDSLPVHNAAGILLTAAACVEILGIVVGIGGLLLVALIAMVRAIFGRSTAPSDGQD